MTRHPRAALEAAKAETRLAALTARQHGLLAILKAKRLEAARREKLPAFVIFHDSVLIEMAVRCPETREDLLQIPGVETIKAERYGATFLTAIANYRTAYE
jgi:ATP-dependent DNA helicase RecQ